jgi:hypothetical protein
LLVAAPLLLDPAVARDVDLDRPPSGDPPQQRLVEADRLDATGWHGLRALLQHPVAEPDAVWRGCDPEAEADRQLLPHHAAGAEQHRDEDRDEADLAGDDGARDAGDDRQDEDDRRTRQHDRAHQPFERQGDHAVLGCLAHLGWGGSIGAQTGGCGEQVVAHLPRLRLGEERELDLRVAAACDFEGELGEAEDARHERFGDVDRLQPVERCPPLLARQHALVELERVGCDPVADHSPADERPPHDGAQEHDADERADQAVVGDPGGDAAAFTADEPLADVLPEEHECDREHLPRPQQRCRRVDTPPAVVERGRGRRGVGGDRGERRGRQLTGAASPRSSLTARRGVTGRAR